MTMVYRRGAATMGATSAEQAFAKTEGVTIIEWAQPRNIIGSNDVITAIEFEYTQLDDQGRNILDA